MNNDYTPDKAPDDYDEDLGYEDDEDLDDLDDDLEDDETESFVDCMKKHNTDIHKLRAEYKKFSEWYNGMLIEIGCTMNKKPVVCRTLTQYIDSAGCSEDTAKLWSVCMSDHSDFIFDDDSEPFDEEYVLYNYMLLSDCVEDLMLRLKKERYYRKCFLELSEKITFCDKYCVDIDLSHFYNTFYEESDPEKDFIMDNLSYVTEKVIRSPELSQIMPVVFTALFIRYPKKMYETQGFEPNFKKLLRHMDYNIENDNGKNIDNFYRQLNMYNTFRTYFSCCDPMLCDAGFAAISNITSCEMIMWEDYPEMILPIRDEFSYRYFDCFPGGYMENPFFTSAKISLRKLESFESRDEQMPPKCQIIANADRYIREHKDISERYYQLICKNETDKCLPLVTEVINNSEIQQDYISPKIVAYAYTSIMTCIMNNISDIIKGEMLDAADKIKEWYYNELT